MNESKNICRLCVDNCYESKSLYDENGRINELYEITYKYLHPKAVNLEEATHLTALCLPCWHHIWDFHNFQESVLMAQSKLKVGFKEVINDAREQSFGEFVIREQTTESAMYLPDAHLDLANPYSPTNSFKPSAVGSPNDDDFLCRPKLEIMDVEPADSDCSSDDLEVSWEQCETSLAANEDSATSLPAQRKRQYQSINDLLAMCMPIIKCALCPESYTNLTSLQSHFSKQHNSEEFHILCCSRKLFKRIQIKEHLLLHKDPESFKCNYCPKVYGTKNSLRRHLVLRHPETQNVNFMCEICDKGIKTKGGLRLHYISVHNTEPPAALQLEEAEGSGEEKQRRRRVLKTYQKKTNFTKIPQQIKHIDLMTNTETENCDVLSENEIQSTTVKSETAETAENFNSQDFILPDSKIQNSREVNTRETKIFDGFNEDAVELEIPSETVESFDKPSKETTPHESHNINSLMPEVLAENPNGTAIKSELPPTEPDESLLNRFDSYKSLQNFDIAPGESNEDFNNSFIKQESYDNFDNSEMASPEHFPQPNITPENLEPHQTEATSEFVCIECGKITYTQISFYHHMWSNHRHEPKHICTQCGRTFKRVRDLTEHIASHQKRDLYACVFCPQTFRKLYRIRHHRKTEHPEESNRNFYVKINEKTMQGKKTKQNEEKRKGSEESLVTPTWQTGGIKTYSKVKILPANN